MIVQNAGFLQNVCAIKWVDLATKHRLDLKFICNGQILEILFFRVNAVTYCDKSLTFWHARVPRVCSST